MKKRKAKLKITRLGGNNKLLGTKNKSVVRLIQLTLLSTGLAMLMAACGDKPVALPDNTNAGNQVGQGQGQGQAGYSTASSSNLLKKLLGKWEASGRVPFTTVVTPGEEVEFRTDNYFIFDKDNLEKSPRFQVTGSDVAGKLLLDYSYQRVAYNFQLSEDGNTLKLAKADVALPTGVTFPYTLRRVQDIAPSIAALTRADGVWEKITQDKRGTCLDSFWSFSRSKFVFGLDGTFQFGALPASPTSPIPPLRTGKYTLEGNILTLNYTGKISSTDKTEQLFTAKCQVKLTQTKLSLGSLQASSATASPTAVLYVQTADNKF